MQYIMFWRARLLEKKDNVFKICFHHEQCIRTVFKRKADKCCNILKSHHCNSKAHNVINLEMAKILKEKDSMMYYLIKNYACRLVSETCTMVLMQAGMQANQFASTIDFAGNTTGSISFFLKTRKRLV